MPIDFYYSPLSAPSRGVMLVARNIGVDLNWIKIDLMSGDQMKPEYLKLNPQHAVPVINDNGFVMNESRAIMQYLVNNYAKDDSLYPKDPKKRALVDMRLQFDQGTFTVQYKATYNAMKLGSLKTDPENFKKWEEVLGWLDTFVKDGYAAGNQLTIADVSIMATIGIVERISVLSKFPNIQQYSEKCKKEIKGYDELMSEGLAMWEGFLKSSGALPNIK